MRTLQANEAKARITAFLAKVNAGREASEARHYEDMPHTVPTTIRYQRMAGQEQRG
jgi:hypothetical protein